MSGKFVHYILKRDTFSAQLPFPSSSSVGQKSQKMHLVFFYCSVAPPLVKLGRAKVAENASRFYKVPLVDKTSVIRGSNRVAASSALAKALNSASIM